MAGVEADGGDDERGAVGPGEFVFEGARCCIADVVGVQADIEFFWGLLRGVSVVRHVVSCVEEFCVVLCRVWRKGKGGREGRKKEKRKGG